MNYLMSAVRSHLRYRWITSLNVLGLALGIACSMVIFLFASDQFQTDSFHPTRSRILPRRAGISNAVRAINRIRNKSAIANRRIPAVSTLRFKAMAIYVLLSTPTITVEHGGDRATYKDDNTAAYADTHFLNLFTR